jgi:hypothetical protein
MESQQRLHLKVASVSLDSLTNQQLLQVTQHEKVVTHGKRQNVLDWQYTEKNYKQADQVIVHEQCSTNAQGNR